MANESSTHTFESSLVCYEELLCERLAVERMTRHVGCVCFKNQSQRLSLGPSRSEIDGVQGVFSCNGASCLNSP